jgi:hypothetical protein
MEANREAALFNIRYAVRVLERHCRLWRRIDGAVRLAALLAGSAAIGALGAQHAGLSMAFGLVFALFQAVEFALRPADVAARALAQRKQYAALFARARTLDDAALADAYDELVAADEVIVTESLRHLAYNDVVRERGLDESACYVETDRLRLMALIA